MRCTADTPGAALAVLVVLSGPCAPPELTEVPTDVVFDGRQRIAAAAAELAREAEVGRERPLGIAADQGDVHEHGQRRPAIAVARG
jgi:hypothetical protein